MNLSCDPWAIESRLEQACDGNLDVHPFFFDRFVRRRFLLLLIPSISFHPMNMPRESFNVRLPIENFSTFLCTTGYSSSWKGSSFYRSLLRSIECWISYVLRSAFYRTMHSHLDDRTFDICNFFWKRKENKTNRRTTKCHNHLVSHRFWSRNRNTRRLGESS